MITMKDIKTCSRKGCDDIGHNKEGTGSYCQKHYRFVRMRCQAQRVGKVVPSWEQCEEMLQPRLDEHGNLGKCPCCKQQMRWKAGDDKKIGRTISLQHNHDGSMCFICHSCNAGHGNTKFGDGYLNLPSDKRYCSICEEVKPLSEFHRDKSTKNGFGSRCKACERKRDAAYRAARDADPEKRSEYLAQKRARYRKYYAAGTCDPAKYEARLAKERVRYRKNRVAKMEVTL